MDEVVLALQAPLLHLHPFCMHSMLFSDSMSTPTLHLKRHRRDRTSTWRVFSLTCCPICFIMIYFQYLYLGVFFLSLYPQANYSHRCLTCRRRTIRRFHARNVLR